ncbi:hypothetical protein [Enterovibrio norvegicus]|uniref:Outer membrane protein beta-barrel domain-containing protein n=1 Tax=Enterovibrio norvegicus TaxID=188144 RepID=A0A2N7LGQ3_9GAMM|nr:hypothetical protein [Enterovibrio norvegicus]PMN64348.1 hypothetical protein BCT27_10320 [Enterovibrio norvegicus]PMN94736.1 hypothetical protein BCT23_01515 [Enterovibrio norvegicus]
MNTRKRTRVIRTIALSLGLFSAAASATNFNYTNLEVGFTSNPSGLAAKARLAFMDGAHFIVNGSSQFEGDWIASGGAGFHAPINGFVDVHGDAQVYSVKFPQDDKHDWGELAYGVNVGVRAWVLPQMEANILVGQVAFDSDDTRSVVEIGGRFHSTDALSLGGVYRFNGLYKEQFYLNVRFEL